MEAELQNRIVLWIIILVICVGLLASFPDNWGG